MLDRSETVELASPLVLDHVLAVFAERTDRQLGPAAGHGNCKLEHGSMSYDNRLRARSEGIPAAAKWLREACSKRDFCSSLRATAPSPALPCRKNIFSCTPCSHSISKAGSNFCSYVF